MAGTGRIIASIYRHGNWNFPGVTGRSNTFPGALTHLYPVTDGLTVNGVTMNTVIQLLPSGLQTPQDEKLLYYSAATVAAIESAST
jgi:hypothetical protein